jgi:2-polyprenyl-6-hydroxyphenyl methylase/3-demethylubiquinone-9 3-methyltransferase
MAKEYLGDRSNCRVAAMNASALAFRDHQFDIVVCIQNGLSAFRLDPACVAREACRVTRPGGRAVFSSYSDRFWSDRLEWFEIQASHGLIGEIDKEATAKGVIVCRDGFRATTLRVGDFQSLSSRLGVFAEIVEVDESTLFCVMHVEGGPRG